MITSVEDKKGRTYRWITARFERSGNVDGKRRVSRGQELSTENDDGKRRVSRGTKLSTENVDGKRRVSRRPNLSTENVDGKRRVSTGPDPLTEKARFDRSGPVDGKGTFPQVRTSRCLCDPESSGTIRTLSAPMDSSGTIKRVCWHKAPKWRPLRTCWGLNSQKIALSVLKRSK